MATRALCAALLAQLFFSGLTSAQQIVQRLEARYRGVTTSEATFLERYTESGRLLRAEAGTAYFRRPGKMRWEYASPEKNLFLVDGKNAWFYVPADHTVTRVPAKRSADWRTPLALLAGDMKLSRVCSRVQLAKDEQPLDPKNVVLNCQLRGETTAKAPKAETAKEAAENRETTVLLEVARATGELTRIQVRDPGGISLEFRFENWQFDPVVAAEQFAFHPPVGVAILNGELPAQSEFAQ
ncbi:MAG TPA: outer membrane lipoprotein carrier protein LolA [Candidatus Dormibacteraeota bacterium]|nr:outer membrane lipoprotein carrier protein LolA [Candidatus Dormibacteraeota bacterium]